MLTVLELAFILLAIGFVPVAVARIVAGTSGARATAHVVFWRVPVWLITESFWLVFDTLFFFLRQPTVAAFAPDEVSTPHEEHPMPQDTQAPILSLAEKMRQRNAEEFHLIRQLTTRDYFEDRTLEGTLYRAFELELVDQVAVHQQLTPEGNMLSVSFVLRAPVSTSKADDTAQP